MNKRKKVNKKQEKIERENTEKRKRRDAENSGRMQGMSVD